MRERLYYFFRSKGFIISLIVIGALGVIAFGIWGGMKIFRDDEPKVYYNVSGNIKNEEKQVFVEGVLIKAGNDVLATSNANGRFEIKFLEAGTILTFEKENYIFTPSTLVVDKNLTNIFIDSVSTVVDTTKQFTIKITDINGLPLNGANVISDKKVIGSTNYKGEFILSLTEGEKVLSFSHSYYSVDSISINYEDTGLNKNLTATFNLNSYLSYKDSEGNIQTRKFTTAYTFRTKDGRLISNGKIYYKVKGEEGFRYTTGYRIIFEDQVYESVFAYAYDSQNKTWICSDVLKTSIIGGDIYLDEGVRISAKIDKKLGTVFTWSGYYFLADEDKNIEVVIRSYEGEKFYKELEYGIPKYEVKLYDQNNNLVTTVDDSISNCEFK